MAAHILPLTLAEFHERYDGAKPAYEYWYGAAIQKSMPSALHGILQSYIGMLLWKAGWNTATEVRLRVFSDIEPVPDVIAIRGKFKGRYPSTAPVLCIEITSPGDSLPNALEKARAYVRWGSEQAWVIDPEKRVAWTISQGDPEPVVLSVEDSLRIGDTGISLAVLFAAVDRKIELS